MFRFKQFTVEDSNCAMKVGTDGVLLASWCNVKNHQHILDIGTGCGLIALMVAQNNPEANIVAIDIDSDAVEQAKSNFANSPWNKQLSALTADIRSFDANNKFDCILCNPPFYTEDTTPPEDKRFMARNAKSLPFEELVSATNRLMSEDGEFNVIIPTNAVSSFVSICISKSLYLSRRTDIKTVERKPAKRTLLCFSHNNKGEVINETIVLMNTDGSRSADYSELTKDFYL